MSCHVLCLYGPFRYVLFAWLFSDDERENENEASAGRSGAVNEDAQRRMFTFSLVNSYGSSEVSTIRDDGQPINFSGALAATVHQDAGN